MVCIVVPNEGDIAAFKDYSPSADAAAGAPAAAPAAAAAPPPAAAPAPPPAAAASYPEHSVGTHSVCTFQQDLTVAIQLAVQIW